jgi:hypothetical protein
MEKMNMTGKRFFKSRNLGEYLDNMKSIIIMKILMAMKYEISLGSANKLFRKFGIAIHDNIRLVKNKHRKVIDKKIMEFEKKIDDMKNELMGLGVKYIEFF